MVEKVFDFFKKNYLILSDQIIVSLGNFLLSIILIRYLGLEKFGIFSFFWLFHLLINSCQLSFIISPMLTLGSKQDESELKFYFGAVFIHQIIFSSILLLITIIFLNYFLGFFFDFQILHIIYSFPLFLFISQIFQFFRRLSIFNNKMLITQLADLTFFLILFAGLYLSKNYFVLSLNIIFLIFVISNFVGIIIFSSQLMKLKFKSFYVINVFHKNYKIGKWLLLTAITQWFSGNLWIMSTGVILGPYYLGIIRSCQTILGVVNPLFQSFENIFPKEISKILTTGGKKLMHNYIIKKMIISFIALSIICFPFIFFSEELLKFFYDVEISNYSYLLIFLFVIVPFRSMQYFPEYGLRSMLNTSPIFISYLLSSLPAVILSKLFISKFQLDGFIVGYYISALISLFTVFFGYKYFLNNKK